MNENFLKKAGCLSPYAKLALMMSPGNVNNLINYVNTIPGFLVNYQIPLLFVLFTVLKGNGVEVGAYRGRTTSVIKTANPDLFLTVVDTFTGSEEHQEQMKKENISSFYLEFLNNMKERGLSIDEVLVAESHKASEDFLDRSLDFVWIDAAHDYFNVKRDVLSWEPKLKSGGIILFHDYPEPNDPNGGFEDLVKAVHETVRDNPLFKDFGYFCGICGAIKR